MGQEKEHWTWSLQLLPQTPAQTLPGLAQPRSTFSLLGLSVLECTQESGSEKNGGLFSHSLRALEPECSRMCAGP